MFFGFLDDGKIKGEKIIKDYEVLGKVSECENLQKSDPDLQFVIAIGNNSVREQIFQTYDLNYATIIHPSATIGLGVEIEEGTVVMANASINANAKIGKNAIINTGAIIEHDNQIGDYVHVSPNGTLCGTVTVGEKTHIGAVAVIKNNIQIASNCIIGVGAAVVKDIEEPGTYVGVPAKNIKQKQKVLER